MAVIGKGLGLLGDAGGYISRKAKDLIDEISEFSDVDSDGFVSVFHRTSKENADKIRESGIFTPKEDGIFFSTKRGGANSDGYGDEVIELKIPADKLELDDIFDGEAHLRLPAKANKPNDVSEFIPNKPLPEPSGLLDMSTPARMARAKEQGYNVDDVTYRWLSEDYPDNKLPTNSRYKFGDAIYSSPEPSYGQAYANEMSSNPVAYPMVARGKIANKNDAIRAEKILIEEGRKPKDYTQTMNAINQQLKTEGFTGLDYAGERMMFDEDTSRSIFAAFDPTKASSSNILASNPAALAGAGILGLGAAAQSNDTYADYSPSNLAKLRNDDVGGYQAPSNEFLAKAAMSANSLNDKGVDDPLMQFIAPRMPSELMNKIAYNDERGLIDRIKAAAGLLGLY